METPTLFLIIEEEKRRLKCVNVIGNYFKRRSPRFSSKIINKRPNCIRLIPFANYCLFF